MSGTSLDGLDLAYCSFSRKDTSWNFSIEETKEVKYSRQLKERLKNAILLTDKEHTLLHHEYGSWLGEQAKLFLTEANLKVDFIASHGHTSHHRPEEGFTFQLGDGQLLANSSQQKVICDFRTKDVALGGQGAPLVPIGDHLLFTNYDFCLNLGGISNVSFIKKEKRIALDIGMANMPLNHITEKIDLEYDNGGKLAQSGKLLPQLKQELDNLGYYKLPQPKSTGYEWFLSEVVPLLQSYDSDVPNLLCTLIHHNCEQIAGEIKKHSHKKQHSILVTGGGAFNDFFIEVLQNKLGSGFILDIPSKKLIVFKEALVFALMGVLRAENEINVFSSVTGAQKDSSSGEIFLPIP